MIGLIIAACAVVALLVAAAWLILHRAPQPLNTGLDITPFTTYPGFEDQPSLSPDGSKVAFIWAKRPDRSLPPDGPHLYVKQIGIEQPLQLTKGNDIELSPIWAPDGQYVIATRTGQLWMYHKEGGSGLQITGLRADGAPAAGGAPAAQHLGAAWAADPRYLWVNVSGNVPSTFLATTVPDQVVPVEDERAPGTAGRPSTRRQHEQREQGSAHEHRDDRVEQETQQKSRDGVAATDRPRTGVE